MSLTVNGITVETNLAIASIEGNSGIIRFTNGSWVNVNTGEMEIRGDGKITLDGDGSVSSEPTTVGPTSYNASEVKIGNVNADVNIVEHDGSSIEVTLSGPQKHVDEIVVTNRGQKLSIEPKGSQGVSLTRIGNITGGNITIHGGSVGSINVGGGSINVGGSSKQNVKIEVKVPIGTSVSVEGTKGNLTIGDTKGNLKLDLGVSGTATVGDVGNTILDLSSSAKVSINSVEGTLKIDAGVGSNVQVGYHSGELKAALSSSAKLTIKSGNVRNAYIDGGVSSHINIGNVSGNLTARLSSSAGLHVQEGEVDRLRIDAGVSARAYYGGSAVDTKVEASSSGTVVLTGTSENAVLDAGVSASITVHHVENRPKTRRSVSSEIKVNNWPNLS